MKGCNHNWMQFIYGVMHKPNAFWCKSCGCLKIKFGNEVKYRHPKDSKGENAPKDML